MKFYFIGDCNSRLESILFKSEFKGVVLSLDRQELVKTNFIFCF